MVKTKDVVYAYEDRKLTDDGRTVSLKSYYYVMNNLFRETINPKAGDSNQQNKYTNNLLRMVPGSEAFSASRFNWIELSTCHDDARNMLPHAPYIR